MFSGAKSFKRQQAVTISQPRTKKPRTELSSSETKSRKGILKSSSKEDKKRIPQKKSRVHFKSSYTKTRTSKKSAGRVFRKKAKAS